METRAHYVLLGTFVLCAMALAFLFILLLGGRGGYDEYDVIFRERVSGLSKGAPVRFNGIQKGEVLSLTIPEDDPSVVIARVKVDDDTPVKTDTRAELELVGFTGLAIIQFVGGSKDEPRLKDVVRGIPKVEADTSGFASLLAGGGDIVARVNRLLSDENIDGFSRIISSIDEVTGVFAAQDEDIGNVISNAAQLTENLASASKRLDAIALNLETLLAGEAPETLAEARAAIADTRKLITSFQAVIDENRDPIALFTEQGLAQVGPAVAEARRLFRTLDEVLRELDRDPKGYLLGGSTPEYKGEGE